jgi:hypothetical protein
MSLLNMEVTVGRKKCASFKKLNQTDTRQVCALLPSKRSLSPSSGRLKSLNHFPSQVGYPSIPSVWRPLRAVDPKPAHDLTCFPREPGPTGNHRNGASCARSRLSSSDPTASMKRPRKLKISRRTQSRKQRGRKPPDA